MFCKLYFEYITVYMHLVQSLALFTKKDVTEVLLT